MKRYHKRCAMDDDALGNYVAYEEAAAIIAEKDKEIAELRSMVERALDARQLHYDKAISLEDQLRASNEALVAAQARISALRTALVEEALNYDCDDFGNSQAPGGTLAIIAVNDNLSALEAHDKEVKVKCLDGVMALIGASATMSELVDYLIKETRNG